MTQWEVLLTGLVILELIVLVLNNFVNPSNKREMDTIKVIQHNTDAIKELTREINSLTIDNDKDHAHFHKSINSLDRELGILKQKHDSDVELLKSEYNHSRRD